MKRLKYTCAALLLAFLAGCGGGGSSQPAPPPNTWDAMTWDQGSWA